VCVVAVAAIACVSNPDPRKRTLEMVQRDGHGGWIVIERSHGPEVAGELIDVAPGGLRVLVGAPRAALISIPRGEIRTAKLWAWETQEGRIVANGLLGSVSTITHGYFLLFSLPIWLLSSTVAASVESNASIVGYPNDGWDRLSVWARFPQGFPAGVSANDLILQQRPPASGSGGSGGPPGAPAGPDAGSSTAPGADSPPPPPIPPARPDTPPVSQ
jgi:hypothetical protein